MAMATSVSNDDVERDLTCGICMEYYDVGVRTPKMLECRHVFCSSCLNTLIATKGIMVKCGFCRMISNLKNGVEKLSTFSSIMPQVKEDYAKRKNIEDELAKATGSWAELIVRRRDCDVQANLDMVLDGLKTIENTIIKKPKDNNGNIADILSGLSKDSTLKEHNMCYIQFKIGCTLLGKVIIRLNFDQAPKMSKRFMSYCTGSSGFSYNKCPIFKKKHGESFSAGKFEDLWNGVPSGCHDEFIADNSTLSESKGAIRMRHRGRTAEGAYVCSEFSIICRDRPNNSQNTTVFGYVVDGMKICDYISRHNLQSYGASVSIHSCGVTE